MLRRVFFSFHYDDVAAFRANVVRRSNVIGSAQIETSGFYDASIWEDAKTKGSTALKNLIQSSLNRTSVTAVLIGTDTYSRNWVIYEIASSFARGNGILGIYIHNIKDKNGSKAAKGPNPLDYLYYKVDLTSSTVRLMRWDAIDKSWKAYSPIPSFPLKNLGKTPVPESGQLSKLVATYDWVDNNGYENLGNWVSHAANKFGR